MQQRGQERPISRSEPDSRPAQLPLQDRHLVAERQDFYVLGPVAIGSSPSSASPLATARYASRSNITTHPRGPAVPTRPAPAGATSRKISHDDQTAVTRAD